jgi:hypothetical protein
MTYPNYSMNSAYSGKPARVVLSGTGVTVPKDPFGNPYPSSTEYVLTLGVSGSSQPTTCQLSPSLVDIYGNAATGASGYAWVYTAKSGITGATGPQYNPNEPVYNPHIVQSLLPATGATAPVYGMSWEPDGGYTGSYTSLFSMDIVDVSSSGLVSAHAEGYGEVEVAYVPNPANPQGYKLYATLDVTVNNQ